MWIWLTISMLLVIACIVFGIYSFISSRTLQKTISGNPGYKSNNSQPPINKPAPPVLRNQPVLDLKTKLRSMDDNSFLSTHHLNELKKRVEALESNGNLNAINEEEKWNDSGEDWEKLYYETRKEKQSLQDNFDNVKDALKENMKKQQELEKYQSGWALMKSDVESGMNEIHSLQNIIEELRRKVVGASERENELAKELADERSRAAGYELIQAENNQLRSEIDMLTNRLDEITEQNNLLMQKLKSLTELGSILEISEYEKLGIKNSVEQLLQKM